MTEELLTAVIGTNFLAYFQLGPAKCARVTASIFPEAEETDLTFKYLDLKALKHYHADSKTKLFHTSTKMT